MSTTPERRIPSARSTTRPGYARITIEVPLAVKERLDSLAVELSDPMRDPVSTSGLIRMAVQALLDKHSTATAPPAVAITRPGQRVYTLSSMPPPDLDPDEIERLSPEVSYLYGVSELKRWQAAEPGVDPFSWSAKLNGLGFTNRQGSKWTGADVRALGLP